MKTLKTLSFIGLFAGIFFVTDSAAQDATVTASGTVQEPLTVTGVEGLLFGDIFPGVNKSVSHDDTDAAQFDIGGEPSAQVSVDFTALPAILTDGASNELTISFAADDAAHDTDVTAAGTATTFDPSVGQTLNLGATEGTLFIWLGATVEPNFDQIAGSYDADITLDVAYTEQ